MDKKLAEIKNLVDSSSEDFFDYLNHILKNDIKIFLNEVQEHTKVYLFSGLIRNYFLKIYEHRDIDIVLEKEIHINKLFEGLNVRKNSFGGYKILFGSGPMDLWLMRDTWAFKHSQRTLEFQLEKKIPDTSFFNFSSIIFCINNKRFYYTNHFLKFLKDKQLDYVYSINANYALCVVNTFYYSDKYHLSISNRLKKLIVQFDKKYNNSYEDVQIKHFGSILYSKEIINKRLQSFKRDAGTDKRNVLIGA